MIAKTAQDFEGMRAAGKILKATFDEVAKFIKPGVTTLDIDGVVDETIRSFGAIPSEKGFEGYPNSSCVSVNDVVVHGIPSLQVVKDGDVVSVDVTVLYKGYQSDAARTYLIGNCAEEDKKLVSAAEGAFFAGMEYAKAGNKLYDISSAIQMYSEVNGFGVVRALSGHGIGHDMHESPDVPNFGRKHTGMTLKAGLCLAIEPMITRGTWKVRCAKDGWTIRTTDGSNAAHYENTIIITDGEPEILTL